MQGSQWDKDGFSLHLREILTFKSTLTVSLYTLWPRQKSVSRGSEGGRELTCKCGQGSLSRSAEGLPRLPLCLGQHPNIFVSELLSDQQDKVPVQLPVQRGSVILLIGVCKDKGGQRDKKTVICQNQGDESFTTCLQGTPTILAVTKNLYSQLPPPAHLWFHFTCSQIINGKFQK